MNSLKSIDFNGLRVFENGEVLRISTNKSAVQTQDGRYQRVSYKENGKLTSRTVSRLVYQLFIEPDFNYKDNRYYIDTNGKAAGEYVLSEIKKVRALGTHKRLLTKNKKWGVGNENERINSI